MEIANKIYNVWILDDNDFALTKPILRSFFKVKEYKIRLHIISSKKSSPLKYSRFVCSYNHISGSKILGSKEEWVSKIKLIIKDYENNYIIPSCEDCVEFLIKYGKELEKVSKIHHVPNEKFFNIAKYKDRLMEFLKENNILVPQTWNHKTIENYYNNPVFPVIAKPIDKKGGVGIVKCETMEEVENYTKEYSEYVIQKFIDSEIMGASIFSLRGEIIAGTVQEYFICRYDPFCPAKGIKIVDNPEVMKIMEKIINLLEWNGVMSVDICREKNTGKLYIIEINTRYWASLFGSMRAGVNFPVILFYEAFNIDYKINKKSNVYNTSLKTAISEKFNSNLVEKYNFSIFKETNIEYLLIDPVPNMITLVGKLLKRIKK